MRRLWGSRGLVAAGAGPLTLQEARRWLLWGAVRPHEGRAAMSPWSTEPEDRTRITTESDNHTSVSYRLRPHLTNDPRVSLPEATNASVLHRTRPPACTGIIRGPALVPRIRPDRDLSKES